MLWGFKWTPKARNTATLMPKILKKKIRKILDRRDDKSVCIIDQYLFWSIKAIQLLEKKLT